MLIYGNINHERFYFYSFQENGDEGIVAYDSPKNENETVEVVVYNPSKDKNSPDYPLENSHQRTYLLKSSIHQWFEKNNFKIPSDLSDKALRLALDNFFYIKNRDRITSKMQKSDSEKIDQETLSILLKKTAELSKTDLHYGIELSLNHRLFLIFTKNEGDLKLRLWETAHKEKIAQGKFSEVYKVINITSGKGKALKIAFKNPLSILSLSNEIHLLRNIHASFPSGKVPGIEKPAKGYLLPNLQIKFFPSGYTRGTFKYFGKASMLYDGTMELEMKKVAQRKCSPDFLKKRLKKFIPLLQGAVYWSDIKNICHGDIKYLNVLCKYNSEDKFEDDFQLFLGDWGGAKPLSDTHCFIETHTPLHMCYRDLKALEITKAINDKNEAMKIHKKRDVFAMGLLLYSFLTGKERPMKNYIKKDNRTYAGDILDVDFLRTEKIPEPIIDLIRQMTHPQYSVRPTMTQAFFTLNQIYNSCPCMEDFLRKLNQFLEN